MTFFGNNRNVINGHILWSCIEKYPLFQDAAQIYDVDNGIVIVETQEDTVERYFFGSTRSNTKLNEFYCHNIDLLYRFIFYFKERAENLIKKCYRQKIYISSKGFIVSKSDFLNEQNKRENFLSETRSKKFSISLSGKDFCFTRRQMQLIFLLSQGESSKEIAKITGITSRTVDFYKGKLKENMGGDFDQLLFISRNSKVIQESRSIFFE